MIPNAKRSRRGARWLLILLVLLVGSVLYVHFLQRSPGVNGGFYARHAVVRGHLSEIWTVKFSPDGQWFASGSVDSSVRVWDGSTGKLLRTWKQPSGVTYLSINPDGRSMATGAYDGQVRLWELPGGRLLRTFNGHAGTVWSVSFSADGKKVASCGQDSSVRLWDTESGRLLQTLRGHTRNVWDVAFSPDGVVVASGSFDGTLRIWDAASGRLLRTLTAHTEAIVSLAFSHNGGLLATTSDDGTIKLWNTSDWSVVRSLAVPEHNQAADFSPDDAWLLTSGRDKTAVGELVQNFFGNATTNKGVSMRLWNVADGSLLQTFSTHGNDVNDVSFSPDGKRIASASSDKSVILWQRQR